MPELQSIYFGKGAFTFCWSNTEEDEEDEEEDTLVWLLLENDP